MITRATDFNSSNRGHFAKGARNRKRSDPAIHEEVNEALYESYEVDATHIEVEVKDGIVTLSGTVTDRQSKRAAEDCIENIEGVLDVRNELLLKAEEDRPLLSQDLLAQKKLS